MRDIQPTDPADPMDPMGLTGRRVLPVALGALQAVPRVQGDGYGGQGDFARMWHFLIQKGWVVVVTTCIALGLGYAYARRAHVVYSATARVQAEDEPPNILRTRVIDERDPHAVDYLQTVAQNLNSRSLLERVAHANNLWDDPRFTNGLALASPVAPDPTPDSALLTNSKEPPGHARVLDALEKIVKVRLRRGTRLIDITVTHSPPEIAAPIANSVVNEYVNENAEREDTSIELATRSLSKQAERLRKKLEESEKALQAYAETNKASSLDERQNTVVAELKELSTKATDAKSHRLKTETEYAQMSSLGTNNVPALMIVATVATDPTVLALQLDLEKAEHELAALRQRYKAKHPKYIQAQSQIDGLKASISNAVLGAVQKAKSSLDSARAAEEALNKALQDQEAAALELSKLSIQ